MENKGRGRPVLNDKEKDIREKYKAALKKKAPEALKVIVEIMTDLTARPVDRLRAAEWILSHCFGDFVAVEGEEDREVAVRIVTVAANKTKEQEQEQEQEKLLNPEDNEVWEAGNAELDNININPDEWDVDSDMEEDIQ